MSSLSGATVAARRRSSSTGKRRPSSRTVAPPVPAPVVAEPTAGVTLERPVTSTDLRPSLAQRIGGRLARVRWTTWLVVAAMLAGAILRFADLGGVPPALNQDEAIAAYDAWSLLHTGRDHLGHPVNPLGFEAFGDWPPPLQAILTVPAVGIFGLRVAAVRAVTAVAGVALIPLMALLGWQLFGRREVEVVAAWVTAILPWNIHMSRFALPTGFVPLAVALVMLGLVRTAKGRSGAAAIWTAAAAAVGLATYQSLRVQVPLLGMVGAVAFAPRLVRVRPGALATALLVLLLVAMPTAAFVLSDDAGGTRMRQTSVFAHDSPLLPAGTKVDLAFLLGQYAKYFSPRFLFRVGDGDPMHMLPQTGVLLVALAPLLVLGLGRLAWTTLRPATDWERMAALFVLLALVVYPLPGALTLPSPHTLRAYHLVVLAALLAGMGVATIVDLVGRVAGRAGSAARAGLMAVCLVPLLVWTVVETVGQERDYFGNYSAAVAPLFHDGLAPALAEAFAHRAEYGEIWVTSTNQPYIYVLFYGAWDPAAVHRDLVVQRNPPDFNQAVSIGNFRFASGPLPADILAANFQVIGQTTDVAGRPAYRLAAATVSGRGRVLVIYRR